MSNLTKEEQEIWDNLKATERDYERQNFLTSVVQRRRDGETGLAEAEAKLTLFKEENRHEETKQWLLGSAVAILGANLTLLVLKAVVG